MEIMLCIAFIMCLVSLNILLIESLKEHMLYNITIVDIILYILGFTLTFIGYLVLLFMIVLIIIGVL